MKTLFEKIWDRHVVLERDDGQVLLYVDRHFLQDGSANAFVTLEKRALKPRAPARAIAVPDHYVPTDSRDLATQANPEMRAMTEALARNAAAAGIEHFALADPRQGIVHVIGPEQGLTVPGITLVCGDSHTPTHGAGGGVSHAIEYAGSAIHVDRAGRHDLRLRRGQALRASGRRLEPGARVLEDAAERCRRRVRSGGRACRGRHRPDRHLGHQPPGRAAYHRARARPGRRR